MNIKYIIIGVVGIIAAFLFFRRYKIEGLKMIIAKLAIKAEQKYNSKEGQDKKQYVIDELNKMIPSWLKWLVSEKEISELIEYIVKMLQTMFKSAVNKQLNIVDTAIQIHRTKNDITLDLMAIKEQIVKEGNKNED